MGVALGEICATGVALGNSGTGVAVCGVRVTGTPVGSLVAVCGVTGTIVLVAVTVPVAGGGGSVRHPRPIISIAPAAVKTSTTTIIIIRT
jgi:hypothetical protein